MRTRTNLYRHLHLRGERCSTVVMIALFVPVQPEKRCKQQKKNKCNINISTFPTTQHPCALGFVECAVIGVSLTPRACWRYVRRRDRHPMPSVSKQVFTLPLRLAAVVGDGFPKQR
jgi:hypothetical protein